MLPNHLVQSKMHPHSHQLQLSLWSCRVTNTLSFYNPLRNLLLIISARHIKDNMVFGVVFRILVDRSLVTRVPRVCECLSCMSSRSGTRSRSQERGGQVILTDQISDTSESETSDRDYLRAAHAFLKIIHISALHMLPVKTALYYTCHR